MKKIIPVFTKTSIVDNTYVFVRKENSNEIGGDICYYGGNWLNCGESWNNYQHWHNYYYMIFQFYLKLKPLKKALLHIYCEYIPMTSTTLIYNFIYSTVNITTYTYNHFKAANKSRWIQMPISVKLGDWNTWDLTSQLNSHIKKGRRPQNIAIGLNIDHLYDVDTKVFNFRSSHYSDRAYRPYLEVEY